MFYEDEYIDEIECYYCEKHEETLQDAREILTDIVNQLYTPNKFDCDNFELMLAELCSRLKVEIIYEPIQIESKQIKTTQNFRENNLTKCA